MCGQLSSQILVLGILCDPDYFAIKLAVLKMFANRIFILINERGDCLIDDHRANRSGGIRAWRTLGRRINIVLSIKITPCQDWIPIVSKNLGANIKNVARHVVVRCSRIPRYGYSSAA